MKTLDEVIKAYEICINEWSCKDCPYTDYNADGRFDCSLCWDCTNDALYYLKELQRFWTESQTNDPLTWDELKQMEGKPVWVEYCKTNMDEMDGHIWVIIHTAYESDEDGEDEIFCNDMCRLPKKWQGKRWQAYRKERDVDH